MTTTTNNKPLHCMDENSPLAAEAKLGRVSLTLLGDKAER